MEGKLHINTTAVHGGGRKDDCFGAINEPIYMTSNYRIPTDGTPVDWSGIHSNIYQRNRNPNQMVLQDKLCALTGAEDGAVFASGVAAGRRVYHHAELRRPRHRLRGVLQRHEPAVSGVSAQEVRRGGDTAGYHRHGGCPRRCPSQHQAHPCGDTGQSHHRHQRHRRHRGHRTQGRRAAERGRYLCRPHLHPAPEPRRGSGYPQHDQVHQRPR